MKKRMMLSTAAEAATGSEHKISFSILGKSVKGMDEDKPHACETVKVL